MKCKPSCAPGGTLSKTRLASCSGGIMAGSTGECWRAAPARFWPDTRKDPPARDTQRDTWRDPLASYSGILSGMLGGIHWRAASYSGGILGGIHWRAAGGILGAIHWRAALAGYWVVAWRRSIANADSNITSNNPFLSGGKKQNKQRNVFKDGPAESPQTKSPQTANPQRAQLWIATQAEQHRKP